MPPGTDRLLKGRERATHQDGSGDHHARRDHLMDGQHRPGAEDRDLQEHAGRLRARHEGAGAVARLRLLGKTASVPIDPPPLDSIQHRHGFDDLGVAQARLREGICCHHLRI